jgi:sugar phosphate isomerase/epimerase
MMTLGCPKWTFEQIVTNARTYGFDAVDWRGVGDDLDITTTARFTTDLARTRKTLDDAGLETSCVSSSLRICDPANRQKNLDEAKRTIEVALGLGAKYVRIFGGGDSLPHEQAAEAGREMMEAIFALDSAAELTWAFETHDHWIRSRDSSRLLQAIPNPAFGILWDIAHTSRVAGEAPSETYAALGSRIRYAHVKDAVHEPGNPNAMKDGWRYVAPGAGSLPISEAILMLRGNGYDGYLCFEHEKRWHPALAEPEVIFPQFVQWVRQVLSTPRGA